MLAQLSRSWLIRILAMCLVLGIFAGLGDFLSRKENFPPYYFRIVMLCGLAAVMAISLNIVNGATGQFSIGHAGFMALGAYTSASFTVFGQHSFLPRLDQASPGVQNGALLVAMLMGGTLAGLAGLLVGLPSLRLKGDYLAIVTLGFGEIIRVVIINIDAVGGPAGFSGYSNPSHGRVTIPQLTTFFWVFSLVALALLFSRNLLRSTYGLQFFAVREDEIAAEAMGVRTTRVKVTAFVMSAFFAGAAGALYAHYESYLKPESFNFLRSIEIVTMVVLGGMGSISGSLVGAVILTAAPEMLRDWMQQLSRQKLIPSSVSVDLVRQLLFALLLVVLMLTRPQGIFGTREISLARFTRKRK